MSYKNTESYIEKAFLYLLALSFLLHVAMFLVFKYFPEEKKVAKEEPVMVDLQDVVPVMPSGPKEKESRQPAGEKQPIPKDRFPKKQKEPERLPPLSRWNQPSVVKPQQGEETGSRKKEKENVLPHETPVGESLFRTKEKRRSDLSHLSPSADMLAKLEDKYRNEGNRAKDKADLQMLGDNDDILASYAHRLQDAMDAKYKILMSGVYEFGSGIGIITIQRDGKISVKMIKSSGSKVLDEIAVRTAVTTYVGPLPKKWPYDDVSAYFYFISQAITR